MPRTFLLAPLFLLIFLLALPAGAAETVELGAPPASAGGSGLALPRFVTTRSDAVNVRSGPGERYPVQWVLKRKGMPVEVIAEYETWRKIRDWTGTEGWVHQALLAGRRAVVVYPKDAVLRAKPDAIAEPVARLQAGVIAKAENCSPSWCALKLGKTTGWVSREFLWGIYPSETLE
jgi:SH3-like domain-containing protein